MRLLQIQGSEGEEPLRLSLIEVIGSDTSWPRYAILSHRWRDGEVLYADMASDLASVEQKKGYSKLISACKIAFEQGYCYLWCDTCCIDKSSSAELSEAINSMYEYYSRSDLCIAYLDDIEDEPQDNSYLSRSTWFTRGWTLQELIAPSSLVFYSRGWKKLGTKTSLRRQTSIASGINEDALHLAWAVKAACVSEKMSWAARRTTTRPEDTAYSLMGLFDVHMPPLYGEGAENAFRRLQLEIIQTTTDHTIFAWNAATANGDMLATSVSHFKDGNDYEPHDYTKFDAFKGTASFDGDHIPFETLTLSRNQSFQSSSLFKPDFAMTNSGLHIQLPMDPWLILHHPPTQEGHATGPVSTDCRLAILACRAKSSKAFVAIYLRKNQRHTFLSFTRVAFEGRTVYHPPLYWYRNRSMPITEFRPVWITKPARFPTPDVWEQFPASIKRIRFELWYTGSSPLVDILWKHNRRGHNLLPLDKACERRWYSGHNIPSLFRKSRDQSQQVLQHYITGTISVVGLRHEVIILKGSRSIARKEHYPAIAFGTIDRNFWIDFSHAKSGQGYHALADDFDFPNGAKWPQSNLELSHRLRQGNVIPSALSSAFHLPPGASRSYSERRFMGQDEAIRPRCDTLYALDMDGDDELWLRIYVRQSTPPDGNHARIPAGDTRDTSHNGSS